ncbi:hypothetical protein Bbelb_048210 [Branchiostoma belcheri]|nr:hypothetical protein Bbelb_048210 [Branchiostoma belcheri]
MQVQVICLLRTGQTRLTLNAVRDQTGLPIVPVGGWTLEEAGSRQVSVVGLEDNQVRSKTREIKRQITALLTISLAGKLLPPQLLYQGKTEACHPKFPFPEEWDVHIAKFNVQTVDPTRWCPGLSGGGKSVLRGALMGH